MLADEREGLADTIKALSEALTEVRDFVRDNRSAIRGNVDNLEIIAPCLPTETNEPITCSPETPTALANLGLAGVGLGVAARADIGATLLHANPIMSSATRSGSRRKVAAAGCVLLCRASST